MTSAATAPQSPFVVANAAIPATIASSATYTSPVLPLFQGNAFLGAMVFGGTVVLALTSSQNATLTINRYLDPLGAVLVDTATSSATGAAASYLVTTVKVPAMYFSFSINNTGGSTSNITNSGVALLPY